MEDAMTDWGRLGAAVLMAAVTLPLTMCGAAPAEKGPPATPAGAPAPAEEPTAQTQGYPAQPGYAPPPPAAAPSGGTVDQSDLAQRRAAARAELDRAQSDLEAA